MEAREFVWQMAHQVEADVADPVRRQIAGKVSLEVSEQVWRLADTVSDQLRDDVGGDTWDVRRLWPR